MNRMMRAVRTAVLSGAMILSTLSIGNAAGPFDSLAGQWSGGGTMTLNDGSSERLRCIARYEVTSNTFRTNMVCASDSYKIDARADVRSNDGFLSGRWSESNKNLGGEISGSANGSTIRANLESGGSTLLGMIITTNGNAQSVRILPQQGTPIKGVQINLTRK